LANGSIFKRLLIGVGIALTLSTAVLAQWSIGKPGTREAPKAKRTISRAKKLERWL
jgi:hypothetical protein